jgi:hypothetical protein
MEKSICLALCFLSIWQVLLQSQAEAASIQTNNDLSYQMGNGQIDDEDNFRSNRKFNKVITFPLYLFQYFVLFYF